MFETVQFAAGNEGETSLPTDWIEGYILTHYYPERLELTGELQTITGTVEIEAVPPEFEATIIDDAGTSHRIDLRSYFSFQGFPLDSFQSFPDTGISPIRDIIQPGRSLILTGYERGQPPNRRFYPLWSRTVGLGGETLVLYRSFFDPQLFDPTVLAKYPLSTTLHLHGSWEQVSPYLIDEPARPLPDEILALGPSTVVLVIGKLEATVPPRLNIDEFYYLDGDCVMVKSSVQQCQYYWPVEIEK
jgi:hypothetical protein